MAILDWSIEENWTYLSAVHGCPNEATVSDGEISFAQSQSQAYLREISQKAISKNFNCYMITLSSVWDRKATSRTVKSFQIIIRFFISLRPTVTGQRVTSHIDISNNLSTVDHPYSLGPDGFASLLYLSSKVRRGPILYSTSEICHNFDTLWVKSVWKITINKYRSIPLQDKPKTLNVHLWL